MSTAMEARVRRKALRLGYRVKKSRCRNIHSNNYGAFGLFDADNLYPVIGWNFDASLAEITTYLDEVAA